MTSIVKMVSAQQPGRLCLLVAILAAAYLLGADAATDKSSGRIDPDAAKATLGGKVAVSQCAKDCIAKAQEIGFERVAGDSMACFMPFKGKRMGTSDCCDKAELLLGRRGALANCMCCPEFARELLQAAPLSKVDTTPDEFLEKLNVCRVPLAGTASCSPRVAKERAPLQPGSNGPPFKTLDWSRPLVEQLNLTGLLPAIGYLPKYSSGILAAQGRAAVDAGLITLSPIVGASTFYSEYVAGFMMLIERETHRYNVPLKSTKLPPLPEQYKADIAWVANLRRGPYPDLIAANRPAQFSPKRTDVLQNGGIADMSPGVVFAGRVEAMNGPWKP